MEGFVRDEEVIAFGCDGKIAGAGALALPEDVGIGVALESGVEREEDDAGVGESDGEQARVGDEDDALRGVVAERLPGDPFELRAVDAEDFDAGFEGLTRDGDEDVLTVGGPDGLCGMTAGVDGVDVEDLRRGRG